MKKLIFALLLSLIGLNQLTASEDRSSSRYALFEALEAYTRVTAVAKIVSSLQNDINALLRYFDKISNENVESIKSQLSEIDGIDQKIQYLKNIKNQGKLPAEHSQL